MSQEEDSSSTAARLLPEFVGQVPNVTVQVGREARLPCIIRNLATYRVSMKGNWDWDWEAIRNPNRNLLLLSSFDWTLIVSMFFCRRPGSAMRRRIFSLCSGKWSPEIRESRCKKKVRWTLAMEAQMMLLRRRIVFAILSSSFAMFRWRIEEGVLIW